MMALAPKVALGVRIGLGLALIGLVVSPILASAQEATAGELEGTWEGVHSVVGEASRTFKDGELRLVFTGKSLRATGFVTPQTTDVAFTLDAVKKHFDYTRKAGEVVECLYRIDGDLLVIAVPRASTRRPSRIDPTTTEAVVLTLKRRQ